MDSISSNMPQDNPDDAAFAEMKRRADMRIQAAIKNLCSKCGERPCDRARLICKECHLEWRRARYKRTYSSNKARDSHLWTKFRLSIEDYDLMFFRQGGMCAVCGKQETKIHPITGKVWPLVVDHNHETGQVRELLCNRCNVLLGRIERDREHVKRLVKYLKKHDM